MSVITSADLKSHLGISGSEDDTEIATAVAAVNQWVEQHCGRNFGKVAEGAESARVFRPVGPYMCFVDDFWSDTNLAVKTDTSDDGTYTTTWSASDFHLEPLNRLRDGQTWVYTKVLAVESRIFPVGHHHPSVQITAAWGWENVPDAVKQAALIQAGRVFKRKDSPEGVTGFDAFGPVRASARMDPDVAHLLAPFRRQTVLIG